MSISTSEPVSQSAERPNRLVTLFTGTKQPAIKDAAMVFFYEGLSVIPLVGKKATINWARHQEEIAIPDLIHFWHRAGRMQNVGVVCGKVSRNLVVMDLDGESAVDLYEATFPHLLNTFTVVTGSGKGKHIYYRVKTLPSTTRVLYSNHQAVELRSNGCYVVAPPSIHPDTKQLYRVPTPQPILELPHLNEVTSWLTQQWLRKQQPMPHQIRRTNQEVAKSVPSWAEAALTYECRDVRLSTEGNRNEQLNRAAYNLGQIVGDGHLPTGRVENALLVAALATGLNEREARATIRSGLKAGTQSPRSTQWQRRNQ